MKKIISLLFSAPLLLRIVTIGQMAFFMPSALANDEKANSVSATDTQNKGTQAQDDAVLEQLKTLLSEDYCPNYDVKKWNFFDPAPACLMEQAKKVAVAVYGPSEFSDEEEQRLRGFVASRKKVQAKLKEVGCKPGEVKKWTDDGQVDAPPECMQVEAKIMQEQARKDNIEGGGIKYHTTPCPGNKA